MHIFPSNSLHTILTRDDKIRYLFQIALDSGSSTEKERGTKYTGGCHFDCSFVWRNNYFVKLGKVLKKVYYLNVM